VSSRPSIRSGDPELKPEPSSSAPGTGDETAVASTPGDC
jgi:hypothetical protein